MNIEMDALAKEMIDKQAKKPQSYQILGEQ